MIAALTRPKTISKQLFLDKYQLLSISHGFITKVTVSKHKFLRIMTGSGQVTSPCACSGSTDADSPEFTGQLKQARRAASWLLATDPKRARPIAKELLATEP